jgi:hypothetical protein
MYAKYDALFQNAFNQIASNLLDQAVYISLDVVIFIEGEAPQAVINCAIREDLSREEFIEFVESSKVTVQDVETVVNEYILADYKERIATLNI